MKKKFSIAERYAVWKSLGPICRWCKTPVGYADCHIDHIIPEKLLEDEEVLKSIVKKYKLNKTFQINSFYNWIPVHPSCNLSKQDQVIEGAPIFLELFQEVKRKIPATLKIYNNWNNQSKTAKITTLIEREAAKGLIDKKTVSRIFAAINDTLEPVVGLTGSTIDNKLFYVPSTEVWSIICTENDFYKMQKEDMVGVTPIDPAAHPECLCTNCKNYGPWDGNKCLVCGNYSFD